MAQSASFLPVAFDLNITRETDFTIRFKITDAAGTPVNISADDVKFTVKGGFEGDVKIATKTSSAGAHADGAAGLVDFDIAGTDTQSASERVIDQWKYEVVRVVGAGSGPEVVHLQGNFNVYPRVGTP